MLALGLIVAAVTCVFGLLAMVDDRDPVGALVVTALLVLYGYLLVQELGEKSKGGVEPPVACTAPPLPSSVSLEPPALLLSPPLR